MGRKWTDEQKQAFAKKMQAAKAAKEAQTQATPTETPLEVVEHPTPTQEVITTETSTEDILKRALEAIETLAKLQAGNSQNTSNDSVGVRNGRTIGTITKYALEAANYPSPVDRLSQEPKLQRFAFNHNYELNYIVSTTSYETKDGLNYIEPKFTLELIRIVMDEATGEPTTGRYIVCRLVMHEDPQTALHISREAGIIPESMDEGDFLNEMRYLQMRDWLLDAFYPKAPTVNQKREVVVDGRVVEFFEASGEQPQPIPFSELKRKF